MSHLNVLIPTYARPAALAVTLTSLCAQTYRSFDVVISDQSERFDVVATPEVQAPIRVLRAHGHQITLHKHLPRRGLAEQRQFLLDRSKAPYVLFLDDDVILESDLIERLYRVIEEQKCGFVGSALLGLSYIGDVRPWQETIEFWDGPVTPETIQPGDKQWIRHQLHNAANLYHLQNRLGLTAATQRLYRVAWVGGCALFHARKLRDVGGFGFWKQLPAEHCGEDVLAQLRVMARYGGCAIIPSGVYHQELTTTVTSREIDAPRILREKRC